MLITGSYTVLICVSIVVRILSVRLTRAGAALHPCSPALRTFTISKGEGQAVERSMRRAGSARVGLFPSKMMQMTRMPAKSLGGFRPRVPVVDAAVIRRRFSHRSEASNRRPNEGAETAFRDEIGAILLGGGSEHLERTARLRASLTMLRGFARCHNDGTARPGPYRDGTSDFDKT